MSVSLPRTAPSLGAAAPLPPTAFRLGYRPALDGLRGVFILLVLGFHLNLPWLRGGFLGVDGFFVLSGFLITTLLLTEWRAAGALRLRAFYLRRALRLLPALYVLLLLYAAGTALFLTGERAHNNWVGIGAAFVYVSNWVVAFDPQRNLLALGMLFVTWSLAIEEQFYLIWPPLLRVLLRRQVSYRRLMGGVLLLILATAGWRAGLFAAGAPLTRVVYGSDTRADALLMGCLVSLIVLTVPPARLAAGARLRQGLLLGLLVPAGWVLTSAVGTHPLFLWGGSTLVAAGVGLLILQLVSQPPARLTRVLAWPPLVGLGRISYGIYLWHTLPALALANNRILGPALVPVQVGVALLVGWISYRYVEQPALRWKQRLQPPP